MADIKYKRGQIFVFGSNRAGRHGKGAALYALRNLGAIYGIGEGLQGFSYAIPTKDEKLKTLSLDDISGHVQRFLAFAEEHSHVTFYVTPIGTGLAGYRHEDIAPLFDGAPENCIIPSEWEDL